MKYLADIAPCKVDMARSDGGESLKTSTQKKVKQELTTAYSPQLNGIAERQIVILEAADLAARNQALGRYPNEAFPKGENLWTEQVSWACNVTEGL
ncbi:unnamed protein product [Ascophyllum nodosum]